MGPADMAVKDLGVSPDLSPPADLSNPADMKMSPDLAMHDMAVPPDLKMPADMRMAAGMLAGVWAAWALSDWRQMPSSAAVISGRIERVRMALFLGAGGFVLTNQYLRRSQVMPVSCENSIASCVSRMGPKWGCGVAAPLQPALCVVCVVGPG